MRPAMKSGVLPSLAYASICQGVPRPIQRFLAQRLPVMRRKQGCFRSGTVAEALQPGGKALAHLMAAPLLAWL
eukprot:12887513-Prorocentrum_lima.AAC.1